MTVDTNSFGLSMNMVSVSITWKEQKEGKAPIWERKLKEKNEAGPSQKVVWRPKPIKLQEIGGRMLAIGFMFSKNFSTQGSFRRGLDTIANLKRNLTASIQLGKAKVEKAKNMSKLLCLYISKLNETKEVLK